MINLLKILFVAYYNVFLFACLLEGFHARDQFAGAAGISIVIACHANYGKAGDRAVIEFGFCGGNCSSGIGNIAYYRPQFELNAERAADVDYYGITGDSIHAVSEK